MMQPSSAERAPVAPEISAQPEYEYPENTVVGDAMLEPVGGRMISLCGERGWPPETVGHAVNCLITLATCVEHDTPILLLAQYREERAFRLGGTAIARPYATPTPHGSWVVKTPFRYRSHDGRLVTDVHTLTLTELLRDFGDPERRKEFFVGREDVARKMREFATKEFAGAARKPSQLRQRINLLNEFRRAGFPFEDFDFANRKRYGMANRIADHVVAAESLTEQSDTIEALAYVTDMTKPQEFAAFFDSVEDQWATMIELDANDPATEVLFLAEGLATWREPPADFVNLKATYSHEERLLHFKMEEVQHHMLVAELYERRAAIEHAAGTRDEDVSLPDVVVELPLAPRPLAVLGETVPNFASIRQDITHIREWRAAGYAVDEIVERDEASMYRAIRVLAEYVLKEADPAHRLEVFDAMEFMFALQRDEQRDELYRLLCERFAASLPLSDSRPIASHIGVAQAIGRMMPYPPQARDGSPYEGPARTAAVLARMFRNRAKQLTVRAVVRYGHPEPEDES